MPSSATTRKAMKLAEKAVKAEIRKAGIPLCHIKATDIKEATKAMFAQDRDGFIAAAIKELTLD